MNLNPNINNNLAYQPLRLQLPGTRAAPGLGQTPLNLQPMNRNDMYMEPLPLVQPFQVPVTPQIRSLVYKNFILVFGAGKETSSAKEILVYNLENQEWKTITPEGDVDIDLTFEYSVCLLNNDTLVLYGSILQNLFILGELERTIRQSCCQILTLTESSSINITSASKPLQAQYGRSKVFDSITFPFLTGAAVNTHNQKLYLCPAIGHLFIVDCSTEEFRVKRETSPLSTFSPEQVKFEYSGVLYKDKIYYHGGVGSLFNMWCLNLNSLFWEEIQFSTLRPSAKIISARFAGDTIFFVGSKGHFESLQNVQNGDTEVITYKIGSNSWATVDTKINLKPGAIYEVYQNTLIFGEPLNLSSLPIGEGSIQNGNSNTNFRASDRKLFIEKPFADITFNVHGEQILAHKALLATRSQHFSNMFQSGMKESTSTVIDIPDTKATIFNGFLEYLYCGNIQDLKEDVGAELLKFADKYSVSGLREYCEQFLINKLKIGNVISLTNLAEFCSAEKLEKAGILFIAENFEEIFKEHDIKQLSSSILFEVFRFVKGKGAK